MSAREEIIQLADNLIGEKGYNAFSFYDISRAVGIKTASIHYHFRQKSDLGIAVIEMHIARLNDTVSKYRNKSPIENLEKLFSIYTTIKTENKVCLVGSLSTDLNTVDISVQKKLKEFASLVLQWVSHFLEDGRKMQVFQFEGLARTKALMVIGNLLSIVQLSRLTHEKDVRAVISAIRKDLLVR
ncbi:MAG TPA: TetR/AcrR family transcriptional regulator [Puia sp.]|nr:TetR/AcrR family transcriptional regulator [Puia sp.]